jgi:hypothetical protein
VIVSKRKDIKQVRERHSNWLKLRKNTIDLFKKRRTKREPSRNRRRKKLKRWLLKLLEILHKLECSKLLTRLLLKLM